MMLHTGVRKMDRLVKFGNKWHSKQDALEKRLALHKEAYDMMASGMTSKQAAQALGVFQNGNKHFPNGQVIAKRAKLWANHSLLPWPVLMKVGNGR